MNENIINVYSALANVDPNTKLTTFKNKIIKEANKELKQIKAKTGIVEKRIYHLENGNVVTFFITPDGYKFKVDGVKINGISKEDSSITQFQIRMCELKKVLDKMLQSKGVVLTDKELFQAGS